MDSSSGWWLLVACAFGAEVLGTMSGFGAATILTPLAALFLDVKTAIAVVACFHLVGNASRLVFFGRAIHWRTVGLFGLTAIACSFLGARVTSGLPSTAVQGVLGVFLLLYVGANLRGGGWRLPNHPATMIGGGAVSGLVAGLLGTGGAIRSACLLTFGLMKERYVGTSAAIAFAVDLTRLPVYLAEGLLTRREAPLVVSLSVAAFAGAALGRRLVHRISPEGFRRFVLGMLALMGVVLLLGSWSS